MYICLDTIPAFFRQMDRRTNDAGLATTTTNRLHQHSCPVTKILARARGRSTMYKFKIFLSSNLMNLITMQNLAADPGL